MPRLCPACREPVEDESEICLGCGEPIVATAPLAGGIDKKSEIRSAIPPRAVSGFSAPSKPASTPATPRRPLRRDDDADSDRCPGCGTKNPLDRERCRGCGSPRKRA